jgi:hypothetical protein
MKKIFFCFLAAILITACNNDKTTEPGSVTAASASPEESTPAETARDCSSLLWFKKGTVLKYDIKGTNTSQTTTTITDVRNEGGALIGDYTTELDNGRKVNSSYRCEGSRIYVDMKSMLNDIMSASQNDLEMEIDDSYLTFPWDMKEGDDLDESVFTLRGKRNGKEFMVMKKIIQDRHVGGSEKVTTPAGTFDCLKITEKWSMSSTIMGREMMKTDEKTTQWFSPKAGLVKTETYDKDGKLQLTTELTLLKQP